MASSKIEGPPTSVKNHPFCLPWLPESRTNKLHCLIVQSSSPTKKFYLIGEVKLCTIVETAILQVYKSYLSIKLSF